MRSKVFSSYSQRPCSGSLGSFCKIILFFAARAGVVKPRQPLCDLNPFRQRLPDPPAGWCRHQGCSHPPSRAPPEGRTLEGHTYALPYRTLAESLFLLRKSATALQRNERSHPASRNTIGYRATSSPFSPFVTDNERLFLDNGLIRKHLVRLERLQRMRLGQPLLPNSKCTIRCEE